LAIHQQQVLPAPVNLCYRRYTETAAVGNRLVDIGGLLPGDTKGRIASTSSIPRQPRYFVAGSPAW
jgi:hypothetical protein